MDLPQEPGRSREFGEASRECGEQPGQERRTAAPIVARLHAWHARSAQLGALANHRILHGESCADLAAEIDAVRREVLIELEGWRMARGDRPVAVYDAERSCRSILATLDALSARLGC